MSIQIRRVSARRIREARRAAGVLRDDLAATVGVLPTAISHYESGRKAPSAALLANIASALNVTMDDLMEIVD